MADPTLIIVWLFSWVAFSVMTARLVMCKLRGRKFITGDFLTMGAMFCVLTRLSLIHVVLIWQSNNMPAKFRATHNFTPDEIYRREVGSKLTLVNRTFYNSYLWLQKLVLLDFTRRLLRDLRWERPALYSTLFVFFVTYVICQVITFTECDPFHLYYQVLPDPGNCSQAQVQLIVLGVLNVITDVMLMVLPLPVLLKWKRPLRQKISLIVLFTAGAFIIAVTIIRLPLNHNNATAQVNRTTWASAELLVASFVANAPALYSLRHRRSSRDSYEDDEQSPEMTDRGQNHEMPAADPHKAPAPQAPGRRKRRRRPHRGVFSLSIFSSIRSRIGPATGGAGATTGAATAAGGPYRDLVSHDDGADSGPSGNGSGAQKSDTSAGAGEELQLVPEGAPLDDALGRERERQLAQEKKALAEGQMKRNKPAMIKR